jgi:lipid-A-disaccharide synthase
LKYIFATLVESAQQIHQQKPGVKFLLPVAPSLNRQYFLDQLKESYLPIEIVEENIYEVAAACDAVLTVSGTVTLQVTLVATPLAIVYKMSPLSYAIGRRLIRVAYAGLTNIIAGKEVAREFIQDAATPASLCDEIIRLLDDSAYATKMRGELSHVAQLMGEPGCSERVAQIVAEMLPGKG